MNAVQIVSDLNDEMIEMMRDNGFYFQYCSDGYVECINFMDICLWDNETGYSFTKGVFEYSNIEDQDDFDERIPDKDLIVAIVLNLVNDLKNLFGYVNVISGDEE